MTLNLRDIFAGETVQRVHNDAERIIERIKEYGVPINRVVCAGGIAEKNPLLMQIYADVTGCTGDGRMTLTLSRAGAG